MGCDFFRDEDGTLYFSPRKRIENMIDGYITMFGKNLEHNVSSPLEKGDHPELDNYDHLDFDRIAIYQYIIGSFQ